MSSWKCWNCGKMQTNPICDCKVKIPGLNRSQRRQKERDEQQKSNEAYRNRQMGANYRPSRHMPYFRNQQALKRRLRDQEKEITKNLKKEGKSDEEIKKALEVLYKLPTKQNEI